ncbi:MAG: hypothetical protein ACAH80_15280 [Alphaproteobacteria bacterium]
MNLKKVIDSPYLAPVMTPLKWIGAAMAFTTGPYIRAAKNAKQSPSNSNPFINYVDKLTDEAEGLVFVPIILGAIGGLIGGIALSMHMLAGVGVMGAIVGGLAITSAVTASSIAAAPAVLGLGIAAVTLVAATSVATVPGFLYGIKQTADHVFRRNPAPPAPAAAPAAPAPSTMEQLTAQLSSMNEAEKQQLLNQLRNKAGNDFGASAAPAAELDKDIAISKTIQLKRRKP